MRFRRLLPLSALALTAVVLAGCSGGGDASSSPSASPASDASDLCAAAASPGAASDGVSVDGDFGVEATATFTAPLEVSDVERTVSIEGSGPALADGDYVTYALSVYDASTGDLIDAAGYGDASLPAMQVTAKSGVDTLFGCATEGSRLVATLPAGASNGPQVYVIDVLDVIPADQWCVAATSSGDQMPTVAFDDDGVPTITIPDSDPPADVEVEVLTEGDGAVVEQGDNVTVQYTGVKWSDGSVFDSSWDRGEPATFSTTGVVTGFQRALEGQKVGSTVLVSMPPQCGYGVAGSSSHALAGETLVFVVKIEDVAAG